MANGDPYSSTLNARSLTTTTVNYFKKLEPEMLRSRVISRKCMEKGNIEYNVDGLGFQWEVQYKLHPASGYNGEDPRTFARHELFKNPSLPLDRGLIVTDFITVAERRANKGSSALIRVADNMVARMKESLSEQFAEMFYNDGGTSGSILPMGLETMFGIADDGTASTVKIDDGTERNSNAADKYGWADDTYATLTTGLGDYGGNHYGTGSSGYWPFCKADPEYDFWTPLILNYTSSAYTGSTDTWADQCVEVIREAGINNSRNKSERALTDTVVMPREMLSQLYNKLGTGERVLVTNSDPGVRSYGFQGVVIDGMECITDYGVPTGKVYGLSTSNVKMLSTGPEIFTVEGDTGTNPDIASGSWRFAVWSLGNLFFYSPRHHWTARAIA